MEFVEFRNDKIYVVDNAQKLVSEYEKMADSVAIHLSTVLPEITKKLASLPLKVKTFAGNLT